MNKRVLIIGAGAHVELGMPTGQQLTELLLLTERILTKFPNVLYEGNIDDLTKQMTIFKYLDPYSTDRLIFTLKNIFSNLNNLSFIDKGQILENFRLFVKMFDQSGQSSIDSFLSEQDQQKRFQQLYFKGFLGLYIQGLQEFASQNNAKPNWIRRLLSQLSIDELTDNSKFSFVTFNYDTFLEDHIFNFLVAQHGKSFAEANDLLEKIDIRHIYGKVPSRCILNRIPQSVSHNGKEIGSNYSDFHLIAADQEISVIRYHQKNYEKVGIITDINNKQLNINSHNQTRMKIAFLGFGFDKYNLNVLFNKMPNETAPDCWNTSKMSPGQFEKARRLIQPFVNELKPPYVRDSSIEDVLFDSNFFE